MEVSAHEVHLNDNLHVVLKHVSRNDRLAESTRSMNEKESLDSHPTEAFPMAFVIAVSTCKGETYISQNRGPR